jgi:hypothetical protein
VTSIATPIHTSAGQILTRGIESGFFRQRNPPTRVQLKEGWYNNKHDWQRFRRKLKGKQ